MKLLTKILILFVFVTLFQWVRSSRMDPLFFKFEQLETLETQIKEQKSILFFGDSVLSTSHGSDADPRGIATLLEEGSGCSVGAIQHAGFDSEMFYPFAKVIKHSSFFPKAVIVPINLRSFSSQWTGRPAYQMMEKKYLAYLNAQGTPWQNVLKVAYRPLLVFKGFELFQNSEETYQRENVYFGEKQVGSVADFEDRETFQTLSDETLKKKLIYHYLYSLKPEHPKLIALTQLSKLLQNDTRVIAYVTPIDWETGEKYWPGEFKKRVAENIEVIRQSVQGINIVFEDLAFSLDAKHFGWDENKYPNEHLRENGRKFLSQFLKKTLEKENIGCESNPATSRELSGGHDER